MEQKTKLSILIVLLIVIIAGSVYLIGRKMWPTVSVQTAPADIPSEQKIPEPVNTDTNSESTQEISGKIRSFNEKAVYIELADDKGFAANINPNTPVITQGVDKPGTLVDLKAGQNVTVKADNANNAIQILIKK